MRRPFLPMLAVVVLLAGCAADPATPADVTAAPGAVVPEPAPPAEPAAPPAAPVVLATTAVPAVAGEDFEVVVTWPGGSPGAGTRHPVVLLPDGSAIGVEEPPDHLVGDVFTAPARVGVMSGDTFTPFPDTSGVLPEHGFRGVSEVAYEDGVTAWVESHSIQGWPLWRLFVHDPAGTRLLMTEEDAVARLPELADQGVWYLALAEGRVSWAFGDDRVSVAVDGTDLRIDAASADAGTTGPEIVTRAGGGVDIMTTGPAGPVVLREDNPVGAVVVCADRVAWSSLAGQSGTHTVHYHQGTGALHRIDGTNPYGALMCAGDLFAFTRLDPDTGLTASTTVIRWTTG